MKKNFRILIFIILTILLSSGIVYSQKNFWERTSGLPNKVTSLSVTSNGDIWAGIYYKQDYKTLLYLYTDKGNTWVQKSVFLHKLSILINPVNNYIFASVAYDGLFRSTDRGENWVNVKDAEHIQCTFITPSGEIYLATDHKIYYSNDNGDTWIERNCEDLYYDDVSCFILGTDGTLYVGTHGGVYRSTDGGDTWLPSSNYNNRVSINDLTISDDSSIFAATFDISLKSQDRVLKSTDGGVFWEQVNNRLGDASHIIYNSITRDIFVNDDFNSPGVYISTNLGASWELKSSGIPKGQYIHKFAFNPNTGQMYVATDNGVYRSRNYPEKRRK
jgi:photosystem II stability/assembly factor-like uncharacterized protein